MIVMIMIEILVSMALSFCSNLGSSLLDYHSLPELAPNYTQAGHIEIGNELFACNDNLMFSSDDTFFNPLYEVEDHNQLFFSDSYTNLHPTFSSPPSADYVLSDLSPELFPLDDFDSFHYPKHQKISYTDHVNSSYTFGPNCFEGYVSSSDIVQLPESLPEIPAPEPMFQVSMGSFSIGRSTESAVKKPNGGVSLSAQSIAARERRRKITDKTQELGKLIPGGNKMNTAEMFQAASKYVKFLQVQVGVLELMGSIQENKEPIMETQELQSLLTSSKIQEKLYSGEKCLVPREFVQAVVADAEIRSKTLIVEEIDQFLRDQCLDS